MLTVIAVGALAAAAALASLAYASALSHTSTGAAHAHRPSHRYVDPLANRPLPPGIRLLYVGGSARVHPVRPGFLGLSFEYPAVEAYAGTNPSAIDPVLVRLVRNLVPGQSPVLRIGGDSTDWTWWPVPGMARPGGVRYSLSPNWIAVTRALAAQLDAHLILGLNLEVNNWRVASTEAHAILSGIPRARIDALEPGNEPELYGTWTYYRARDGRKLTGRPTGYTFGDFEREFRSVAKLIPRVRLAGPTTGSLTWMAYLRSFLATERHLALVTLHRYPLQLCYLPPSSPRFPTIAHLLSPESSRGLAAIFKPYVALAHAHGLKLRVDEINTVGCGNDRPVTETFASALWALNTLLALATQGVDGVNIHTFPGATYELFRLSATGGRWRARVMPEYYGLLMFALAVPPGSQPLNLSGPGSRALSSWAVRGPDGRTRVVLINDGARPKRIGIRDPHAAGTASLIRLIAPGAAANHAITIAGQSFGAITRTGRLTGRLRTTRVRAVDRTYAVEVAARSAALVMLP